MGAEPEAIATTDDAVLGGRLRLRQPRQGHRVGHDAVLLAAVSAGRAGEHMVELGAGVGGAGLALALRVSGLQVTLIEIDTMLCALAADNARRNGLAARVRVVACDVEDAAALAATGLAAGSADRVLMNPPFRDATRENVSPDPRRRLAHAAPPGLLRRWIASAAWLLKPQGVLTLIWRADALAEVRETLAGSFGGVAVLPVKPRADAAAIRVLVRATKSCAGAPVDYPPLILNDDCGKPTAAAEAVLRGGETLGIAET